jgi:hypothetical protein
MRPVCGASAHLAGALPINPKMSKGPNTAPVEPHKMTLKISNEPQRKPDINRAIYRRTLATMRRTRQLEEPRRMMPVGDFIPLFDLFFDLPHPNASAGAERARIIEPPDTNTRRSEVFAELYEAGNISRIARFAFPEHDDQKLGE